MTVVRVELSQYPNSLDRFMKHFSMVAQIVGLAVITAGVMLFSLPAGLIVGGACCVLIGFAFGMSK